MTEEGIFEAEVKGPVVEIKGFKISFFKNIKNKQT